MLRISPTCDQKRALFLGHRLRDKVFADVPHRQWVFTIPKRFRIYFRFDRSLLGKLCRAAFDTVREVYALEIDGNLGIPAMLEQYRHSAILYTGTCIFTL